jgi:hypothetical protein
MCDFLTRLQRRFAKAKVFGCLSMYWGLPSQDFPIGELTCDPRDNQRDIGDLSQLRESTEGNENPAAGLKPRLPEFGGRAREGPPVSLCLHRLDRASCIEFRK